MLLSGLAGLGVTLTSHYRSNALWPVWASLAIGLCAAAGLVAVYGMGSWRTLTRQRQVPLRSTVIPTVLIGVCVLLVLALGEATAPHPGSGWRGDLLVVFAYLGGGFAGVTMFGIRSAANYPVPQGDIVGLEQDFIELLSLRRLLQRLTSALGSLVALSTLALGASVLMTKAPAKEVVIVFGGGGTVLVGLFHAAAASAIRAHGERSVAAISASGPPPTDPAELVDRLEQRSKLEQLIGIDRTVFADLQTTLPVLSPLIASAAILLPK
ncbi:hypothetical protein [Nocardia sp. BMG111209]|uniref:hypothetical protein n=1 Tax=Nocardia sp. BMG111209 TaxID=1160137 RepID=UPI00037F0EDB|nr:hypothetical protein [Nocardia sp. BMG111209]